MMQAVNNNIYYSLLQISAGQYTTAACLVPLCCGLPMATDAVATQPLTDTLTVPDFVTNPNIEEEADDAQYDDYADGRTDNTDGASVFSDALEYDAQLPNGATPGGYIMELLDNSKMMKMQLEVSAVNLLTSLLSPLRCLSFVHYPPPPCFCTFCTSACALFP